MTIGASLVERGVGAPGKVGVIGGCPRRAPGKSSGKTPVCQRVRHRPCDVFKSDQSCDLCIRFLRLV